MCGHCFNNDSIKVQVEEDWRQHKKPRSEVSGWAGKSEGDGNEQIEVTESCWKNDCLPFLQVFVGEQANQRKEVSQWAVVEWCCGQ